MQPMIQPPDLEHNGENPVVVEDVDRGGRLGVSVLALLVLIAAFAVAVALFADSGESVPPEPVTTTVSPAG